MALERYTDRNETSRFRDIFSDADCSVYKTPYIRADPLDPNSLAVANWVRKTSNELRALKVRTDQNAQQIAETIDQVRSNSHKIDLLHTNTVLLSDLTWGISDALSTANNVNSIADIADGLTDVISSIPVVGGVFSLGINAISIGFKLYGDNISSAASKNLADFRSNVLTSTFNDMIFERAHSRFRWADDQIEKAHILEEWFNEKSDQVSRVERKPRNPEISDLVKYYKLDRDDTKMGVLIPSIPHDGGQSTVNAICCDLNPDSPQFQINTFPLPGASSENILMTMYHRLVGNNRQAKTITEVGSEPLATTGNVYSSRLEGLGNKLLSLLPKELDDIAPIVRSFLHNGSAK